MDFNAASESEGYVDPWADIELDFEKQTGADWYNLMLSATYGGKPVHGLNAAPSSETLAKVDNEFAGKYAHGTLRFVERTKQVPAIGPGLCDQHYTSLGFKGVTSSASTFLAVDQGVWEPSIRLRAKESAFLAASIAAHTGDRQAAVEIVGKITSDVVDEEAVNTVLMPMAHLKREVISVSKPSHRVFSRGSIQRAITWDDEQLVNEKLPPVAAVDWGRITTIARYIAEVNCQLDPKFRALAASNGVHYALIKGAWAYVTSSDYILTPEQFANVPTIDLEEYGIPSIRGAFQDHELDLVKAAQRMLNNVSYDTVPPSLDLILKIAEEAKGRLAKRKRIAGNFAQTDVLAAPSAHTLDTYDAARITATSATSMEALKIAAANKIKTDNKMVAMASQIAAITRLGGSATRLVDQVTTYALSHDVWISARAELALMLGNEDRAHIRMSELKRRTFASSIRLETNARLSYQMISAARAVTIPICKAAVISPAPEKVYASPMNTMASMRGALAMKTAASFAVSHLKAYKDAWADRYDSWARAFATSTLPNCRKQTVLYGAAAKAFRSLNSSTCLAVDSRFIEGTRPRTSYLYEMAVSYCKKRCIDVPALERTMYANAKELAIELDRVIRPPVSFRDAEKFAYERVAMFAGDMSSGTKPHELPSDPTLPACIQASASSKLAGVITNIPERKVQALDNLGDIFGPVVDLSARRSQADVLASYSSLEVAERHAKENGYPDFNTAYQTLKEKAVYDPESTYTQTALEKIQEKARKANEAEGDTMVLY